MSTIDKNDPRLTAYALGELAPEECVIIETALQNNSELQAEVDDIRAMTSMLGNAFAEEEQLELNDQHRHEVMSSVPPEPANKSIMFYFTRVAVPAAAALFVFSTLIPAMMEEDNREFAKLEMMSMDADTISDFDDDAAPMAPSEPLPQPSVGYEQKGKDSSSLVNRNTILRDAPVAAKKKVAVKAAPASYAKGEKTEKSSPQSVKKPVSKGVTKPSSSQQENNATVKLQLAEAKKLYKDGDYEKSLDQLEEVIVKDPYNKEAIDGVRKIYKKTKEIGAIRAQSTRRERVAEAVWKSITPLKPHIEKPHIQQGYIPVDAEVSESESYDHVQENGFKRVADEPRSTFSIDVDTASYSNVRRFINQNQLPPADSVRIEEMINYFTYDYPAPKAGQPFSVSADISTSPWDSARRIVRIGLKGKEIAKENRPASNLVFLLDVSGSMNQPNKLPFICRFIKVIKA